MRKIAAIVLFALFFTLFSEVVSYRQTESLTKWAANYVEERTAPVSAPPTEENIGYQIMMEQTMDCAMLVTDEVAYIRDKPKSRIPVYNMMEVQGKLFFVTTSVSNAVTTYAGVSGYWTEKTEELDTTEPPDIVRETEFYREWYQQRKEEIVTLQIVERGGTPDELKDTILSYSLEGIPLLKRLLLKPWDTYTKERAQTHYDMYIQHLTEDDIISASVDLSFLSVVAGSQEQVMENIEAYFERDYYSFEAFMIFALTGLVMLSSAATGVSVLLIFYRKNPAVLPGVITGVGATLLYAHSAVIVLFVLAGPAAIFLYYRMHKEVLSYRESSLMSLKAGFILFLTQYVFGAALTYAGATEGAGGGLHSIGDEFLFQSVNAVLEIFFICLFSVIGGLAANYVWRKKLLARTCN